MLSNFYGESRLFRRCKIHKPNLPHGILKGKVTDSTGHPLQGMTVTLVRTSTGESNLEAYSFTTQTKTDGTYEISLTQGTYEMVIYSKIYGEVILTPTLPEHEYHVILTWRVTPTDLDSHLTYHVGGNQKFHVYYSDKQGTIDGKTVAKLDLDDTTSYGPETITIDLTDELLENGLFRYSVQNFTDRNNPSSTRLASSGAMVRVYSGNHLLETFHVPENEMGTVWCVFTLDKSGLKPRNYIYSAGPTGVM